MKQFSRPFNMASAATFYTVATMIFIAANVILCQKAGINNDDNRNLVSTSSKDNPKIDPLPSKIFKRPLTDLLPPEIFSQRNPLVYFLTKVAELQAFSLHQTDANIKYYLIANQFPRPYIPYAKVLSSLLPCLIFLEHVNSAIIEIQDAEEFSYPALPSDIPPPDNRFTALFSEAIFEDDNPPSIVLFVLLNLPEDKTNDADVKNWLRKLIDSKSDFSRIYHKYMNKIYYFLNGFGVYALRRLKKSVVELQQTISDMTP